MVSPNGSVEGTVRAGKGVSRCIVVQRTRGWFGRSLLPGCLCVDLLQCAGEGKLLSHLTCSTGIRIGLPLANILCLTFSLLTRRKLLKE